MKQTAQAHQDRSESAIRATGERVTQPRVAVLSALLTFNHAASHLELAAAIGRSHAIDRVTVYRVLDWLVGAGLAHRIAGDDRVWRFVANLDSDSTAISSKPPSHHQHAHFTCNACGQTFCLDAVQPKVNVKLPAGFTSSEVDVKLRGRCAQCA
jgi:Fur family transcriptional regulator, ferric uptake regulator